MKEINAIGDSCPIPVIKAKNAMKEMNIGEEVVVSVDNLIATQNLEKLAKESGAEYSVEKVAEDIYNVTLTKTNVAAAEVSQSGANTVVAITSDKMGEGNDELGKVLIKAFVYALTELEIPPNTIIFYNGGAQLTTEGSEILEDLEKLQSKGTNIMTCGTCLNYYGLSEKLKIGEVSNMYTIVEKLSAADKIIRP